MTAHTLGPWTAVPEQLSLTHGRIADRGPKVQAHGMTVARVDRIDGGAGRCAEAEANAVLMAAAPLMRDTLRLALRTMGAKGGPTAAERDMAMASIRHALRIAEPVTVQP